MTTLNIASMLVTLLGLENVYAGTIDANQERCIGVYNAKSQTKHRMCIGGASNTKMQMANITILVHWTEFATSAEVEANAIVSVLSGVLNHEISGVGTIKCINTNQPIPIGRDERGVFEYAINATVIYEEV